jgi:hypothetical protein
MIIQGDCLLKLKELEDNSVDSIVTDLQTGVAGEHLVCADLIMKGHNAYLSDQGLPYDVVADINGKLYKIQVKTTSKYRSVPQRKTLTPAYLFWIKRCGKNGKNIYKEQDYDFMALVALDKKIIGYLPFNNVKGTMHLNESKLTALTFEKLWK